MAGETHEQACYIISYTLLKLHEFVVCMFGPRPLSPGVKRPKREADHSHLSTVEVKNARNYTSTPPSVFMKRCLVKHRDNLTLTFTSIFKHFHWATILYALFKVR